MKLGSDIVLFVGPFTSPLVSVNLSTIHVGLASLLYLLTLVSQTPKLNYLKDIRFFLTHGQHNFRL